MSGARYSTGGRDPIRDPDFEFEHTYEKPDEQRKDDGDVPAEFEESRWVSEHDFDARDIESFRMVADPTTAKSINYLLENSSAFREFIESDVPESATAVHSHKDIPLEDEDIGAQAVTEVGSDSHTATMNKHESHPSTKSFKEFAGLSAVVCVLFGVLFTYLAYAGALGTVPAAITVVLLVVSFAGFARLWYEL